jgi:glycosyltransferase involved in cell wall biosynthesis
MVEISVIVPCYKVEKYISNTIESVLKQTFKDWELILVDDGSPDLLGKICDEYAQKDSRIKVFHKDNGGVMSARMFGLKNAIGNFVMFLDGDDMYTEKALELMYNTITEKHVDWVCASNVRVDDNNNIIKPNINKWLLGYADSEKFLKLFCREPKTMHTSIYRKSILDSKEIIIDPKIKNNEDFIFNLFLSDKIKCAYGIKDIIQRCHVHSDSASRVYYPVEYWYYVFEYLQKNCSKFGVSQINTNCYLLNFMKKFYAYKYKDYDLGQINTDELSAAKYSTYYGFYANIILFHLKHPKSKLITILITFRRSVKKIIKFLK